MNPCFVWMIRMMYFGTFQIKIGRFESAHLLPLDWNNQGAGNNASNFLEVKKNWKPKIYLFSSIFRR